MKRLLAIVGVAGAAAGALLTFFFDKGRGRRRRRLVADKTGGAVRRSLRRARRAGRGLAAEAYGFTKKATHLREKRKPQPDDTTLAQKVETEIFRSPDVPKGKLNVNAERGVVYLRGEVDTPELIDQLVERTRKVRGVRDVQSLLHLPNTPAPTHH